MYEVVSNILTIAYTTEGSTDQRFLKSIISKVFEEVAYNCKSSIEVFDPVFIKFPKKDSFVNDVINVSVQAHKIGINVLCVHVDADSYKDVDVIKNKIHPSFEAVSKMAGNMSCKNLVAIIPIHMTEAWMLADKDLLKDEIGTGMSNIDLGINRTPESIANPKEIIQTLLTIAQDHLPKRRKRLYIEDLYQPIGQSISMERLETLESFNKFKLSVEIALKELNYLN